jgi:hypothetical protein
MICDNRDTYKETETAMNASNPHEYGHYHRQNTNVNAIEPCSDERRGNWKGNENRTNDQSHDYAMNFSVTDEDPWLKNQICVVIDFQMIVAVFTKRRVTRLHWKVTPKLHHDEYKTEQLYSHRASDFQLHCVRLKLDGRSLNRNRRQHKTPNLAVPILLLSMALWNQSPSSNRTHFSVLSQEYLFNQSAYKNHRPSWCHQH